AAGDLERDPAWTGDLRSRGLRAGWCRVTPASPATSAAGADSIDRGIDAFARGAAAHRVAVVRFVVVRRRAGVSDLANGPALASRAGADTVLLRREVAAPC